MQRFIYAAILVAALLAPAAAIADGRSMTLEEAVALAERHSPTLIAARAQTAAARGELEDVQAPLWNNPEIVTDGRRRSLGQTAAPDVTRYDAGIGLFQRFELGGQQQARRGAAEAGQRAVEKSIEDVRRAVRGKAAQRFLEVLSLQQRVQMEEQALDLLRRAAALTGKRVRAGEDSRLDGNLAAIEVERGANQTAKAAEQLVQARAALSEDLQLEPGAHPQAAGNLDAPAPSYMLSELLVTAAMRPRLQQLAAREEAARRRLDLERGNTYPDVTVGLTYGVEKNADANDQVTTLAFVVPLPIFRRNAAGIGRARTELDQARIERQATERDTQAAVKALWVRLQSLQQRVGRLRNAVLPNLDENQRLSFKALQAGEFALSQFLLVRRQVLDGRRDLLEAQTELRIVRVELETAAGWPSELPPLEPLAQEVTK